MGHGDRFKTWKRILKEIVENGTCRFTRIPHALLLAGMMCFQQEVSTTVTAFAIPAVLIFQ
jgi:hypothetical protein